MINKKKAFIFENLDLSEDTTKIKQCAKRTEMIEMLTDFDFSNKYLNIDLLEDDKNKEEKMKIFLEFYKNTKISLQKRKKPPKKYRQNIFSLPNLKRIFTKNSNTRLPTLKITKSPDVRIETIENLAENATEKTKSSSNLLNPNYNLRKSIINPGSYISTFRSNETNSKNKSMTSFRRAESPKLHTIIETPKKYILESKSKALNCSLKMNKALDDIVAPEMVESCNSENPLNLSKNKKKKYVNVKKYVTINCQKFFYKNEKKLVGGGEENSKEIEEFNKKNNFQVSEEFQEALYHFLNSNNYLKYIEKFVDKTHDQHIIKIMTKYLKDTLNIKPPSFSELQFLENILRETLSKKENLSTINSSGKKESFSSSPKHRVITTLNNHTSSEGNLGNYLETKKKISKFSTNLHTITSSKSKQNFSHNSTFSDHHIKNLLVQQCTNQIRKNERLINKNISNSNKTDNNFRDLFKKVFTRKDIELEKELLKDHITTMKKAGEFIYGEKTGYFTNNHKRIFKGL